MLICICATCPLPAPAQATRLQVSNGGSTDSLQVRWGQTSGELDFYRILLVHDSIIIKNQSVEANITGISFRALIPGALYRVVLTTIRAGQSSRQTVAEGRTGTRLTCHNEKSTSQSFPKSHKKVKTQGRHLNG